MCIVACIACIACYCVYCARSARAREWARGAGDEAPRLKDLRRYLRDHPDMEAFNPMLLPEDERRRLDETCARQATPSLMNIADVFSTLTVAPPPRRDLRPPGAAHPPRPPNPPHSTLRLAAPGRGGADRLRLAQPGHAGPAAAPLLRRRALLAATDLSAWGAGPHRRQPVRVRQAHRLTRTGGRGLLSARRRPSTLLERGLIHRQTFHRSSFPLRFIACELRRQTIYGHLLLERGLEGGRGPAGPRAVNRKDQGREGAPRRARTGGRRRATAQPLRGGKWAEAIMYI